MPASWQNFGRRWQDSKITTLAGKTARPSAALHAAAFNSDESLLALAGGDRYVSLWQIPEGKLISTFKGHRHTVTSVSISPDGRTIVSGDQGFQGKLWQVASGREMLSFDDGSWHAEFFPGTDLLLTTGGRTSDYSQLKRAPSFEEIAAKKAAILNLE